MKVGINSLFIAKNDANKTKLSFSSKNEEFYAIADISPLPVRVSPDVFKKLAPPILQELEQSSQGNILQIQNPRGLTTVQGQRAGLPEEQSPTVKTEAIDLTRTMLLREELNRNTATPLTPATPGTRHQQQNDASADINPLPAIVSPVRVSPDVFKQLASPILQKLEQSSQGNILQIQNPRGLTTVQGQRAGLPEEQSPTVKTEAIDLARAMLLREGLSPDTATRLAPAAAEQCIKDGNTSFLTTEEQKNHFANPQNVIAAISGVNGQKARGIMSSVFSNSISRKNFALALEEGHISCDNISTRAREIGLDVINDLEGQIGENLSEKVDPLRDKLLESFPVEAIYFDPVVENRSVEARGISQAFDAAAEDLMQLDTIKYELGRQS